MIEKSSVEIQDYLSANPEALEFFKAYGNISKEMLVPKVQKIYSKALNVHNYRCLVTLKFLAPRIVHNPFYEEVILSGKEQSILDIGCALGTDLRKIYLDGPKNQTLYGLDLENKFIELGYELFDDWQSNKIHFTTGNILEEETVERIRTQEHWDVIYSSSVIHLLGKKDVEILLQNIYSLLSEGGIFFGQTTGLKVPQERLEKSGRRYYLHSKDSLQYELGKAGFRNIQIEVKEHEKYSEKDKQDFYEHRDTIFFYVQK